MAWWKKHEKIETNVIVMLVLSLITVSIGGLIEIVPLYTIESTIERVKGVRPYTPLELAGRNIYIREGCYNCHSQQVRPFRDELERYGHYSLAAESMYDHPFQWGSKRTGPDLARVGGKYADVWHYKHMIDPREISPGSNMPPYPHLATWTVDFAGTAAKMRALRNVGVPYKAEQIQMSEQNAQAAATAIATGLANDAGVKVCETESDGCELVVNSRLVALIAYLQRLGKVPETKALATASGEAAR